MLRRSIATVVVLACVAVGCSSASEGNPVVDDPGLETGSGIQTETTEATETPAVPSPDLTSPDLASSIVAETSSPDASPPPECAPLTDFSTDEGQRQWQSVNDDVMGGQSEGGLSFVNGLLVFEGSINTNGGGFSSIRLPIEVGVLTASSSILISLVADERSYMVTLDDQAEGRNPRVTHRATIATSAINPGEPFVATIPLATFTPAIFGQAVDDSPVEAASVDELGLMISDGADGAFRLDVRWIAGCP